MPHPLDGPRHKLGRAEAQLDQLDAEVARFLRRDTHEITQQFDPKSGRCTLQFVIKHPPPLSWSVSIGEIVHNLRSALDHLACQLFRLHAAASDCEDTAFPLLTDDTDAGLDKWIDKRLPGLPEAIRAKLRESQPYKRGHAAKQDPLAILNRLSNWDKHRLLVPIFAAVIPGSTSIVAYREWRDVEPNPRNAFKLPTGPLPTDAPLAELEFPITGDDPYVQVETHVPIDVSFRDGGPIVTDLRRIGSHVSHMIFNKFVPFFPPVTDWELAERLPPARRPPGT